MAHREGVRVEAVDNLRREIYRGFKLDTELIKRVVTHRVTVIPSPSIVLPAYPNKFIAKSSREPSVTEMVEEKVVKGEAVGSGPS